MKNIYVICTLFIYFIAFSQKNNNYKFKTISFIQRDSISNLEDYKKGSVNSFMKLSNQLSMPTEKKDIDDFENTLSQKQLDEFIKIFHYSFVNKNIWKRWETKENDDILTYPIFTDFSKGKEYYEYPYNGIEEYSYIFEKIKDLKIQEFREEKKTINGIECFKIKCYYSQINEYEKMDGMLEFPDEVNQIDSEMWVTEKIKSIYHPAFKIREILEKYYPLDIIEKNSSIQGMIRKIKLKKVN